MLDEIELQRRFTNLSAPTPMEERLERQGQGGVSLTYVRPRFIRTRLDECFRGHWTFECSLPVEGARENGQPRYCCKGRLTIYGVWREDIGRGRDEKAAASDALKRCGAMFGIARDLQYSGTVPVTPSSARAPTRTQDPYESPGAAPIPTPPPPPKPKLDQGMQYAPILCPWTEEGVACEQKMWDNRTVRKGNQPLFRCTKNRNHVVWIDQWDEATQSLIPRERTTSTAAARAAVEAGFPPPLADEDDDLPF